GYNRSMPPPSPTLRVRFHGAAGTVTGSMHLVEARGRRVLLDCGLYQGRRAEAYARNSRFPFDPKDIDAVLLSHAHIDHSGNLPALVRQGYRGPIHCTPATRDLIAVMLADSARIQEEDATYLNRKRRPGDPKVRPLYEPRDVIQALRQVHSAPYDRPLRLDKGIKARFVEAGHLLGSAMIALEADGTRLTFTGDLGRRGLPILRDPDPVPACDLLISESTYGGQTHEPVTETTDHLGEILRRVHERRGKLLVPAFSLGRTQSVLYAVHELRIQGKLPDMPIVVDSPLASEATEVFRLHPECFDEATLALLEHDPELFGGRRVRFTRDGRESQALNGKPGPMMIIAASGMCEAGRILHHIKHNIEDPNTTLLIVGFQAPDTLGRRLADRVPEVRVLDKLLRPRAEVITLSGFSSHADQGDFDAALGPLASATKKVCLVHGEPDRSAALAEALRAKGFADVTIPQRGDVVEL
ncbi:MAG: MBL fold metallo-hydrolase, partial [Gemmataceae bacterium]